MNDNHIIGTTSHFCCAMSRHFRLLLP